MKLHFKQDLINSELYNDLDFDSFIKNFDLPIDLIPEYILDELPEENAVHHFKELRSIQQKVKYDLINIDGIYDIAREIPLIDDIFPFLEKGEADQFHYFQLYRYFAAEKRIKELELQYPLVMTFNLDELINELQKYFSPGLKSLKESEEVKNLSKRLKEKEKDLQNDIKQIEKDIFNHCSLKMIYPYPKEIPTQHPLLEKIKANQYLTVSEKNEFLQIDFKVPASIIEKENDKKNLENTIDSINAITLNEANRLSAPKAKDIQRIYLERKKRIYQYILLIVARKLNLSIPLIKTDTNQDDQYESKFLNLRLPSLEEKHGRNYRPLNVTIHQGASVLFGANMAGKTTLLKTIYFNMMLLKVGLPVAGERMESFFPNKVLFHVKSSGHIQSNLSTFGEEINFFTQEFGEKTLILIDEFFQSTNPVSGEILSKIFLDEFKDKKLILLATTQYPGILNHSGIKLYKMKDATKKINSTPRSNTHLHNSELHASIDKNDKISYDLNFSDLLVRTPYEVEEISKDSIAEALEECLNPIYLTFYFPLPHELKMRIKKHLENDAK